MENNFCRKCGAQLEPNAQFCRQCGTPTENPAPASSTPSESNTAQVPIRKKKKGGIFKWILIAAVVIIAIAIISNSGGSDSKSGNIVIYDPIVDVKGIVFDQYDSQTFGQAVEASGLENVKWSSDKVDKTHYTVTLSAFVPELFKNCSYVFDANYVEDQVYVSLKYVTDGDEKYEDWASASFLMNYIYESAKGN